MFLFRCQLNIAFLIVGLRNQIYVENQGLAYKVSHRYKRYEDIGEDLEQEIHANFVTSIGKWDSDRAMLSSYTMPHMNGSALHYLRDKRFPFRNRNKQFTPNSIASLSQEITTKDCSSRIELGDTIPTKELDQEIIWLQQSIEALRPLEKDIIRNWYNGYTAEENSVMCQVSIPTVHRIIKNVIQKLRRELTAI